ncbi:hypothetical protein CNMCM8980_006537 [Aspergillus fumigatiaffinis]|nr:hypothetical protein CNMCM8980_006537 [Aspergillus fumigatiaffinis]
MRFLRQIGSACSSSLHGSPSPPTKRPSRSRRDPCKPRTDGGSRAPPQKVLGYIRYDHIKGSAEFANFSSRLDPECLEMGHTTKREDRRLAGGHGEGLKIAALVLSRGHHHVKVTTNGSY